MHASRHTAPASRCEATQAQGPGCQAKQPGFLFWGTVDCRCWILDCGLSKIQNPKLSVGQVTLEYFILLAAVALVTVIGLATFDGGLRGSVRTFFDAAANRMAR